MILSVSFIPIASPVLGQPMFRTLARLHTLPIRCYCHLGFVNLEGREIYPSSRFLYVVTCMIHFFITPHEELSGWHLDHVGDLG
jgi:hypothetical protein